MIAAAPPALSAQLEQLIASIRDVVQTNDSPQVIGRRVAEIVQPYLGSPELLCDEQMAPDEECYRQHVLHVEPDGSFSIVALVWLPGQATPVHDHVSWCVVGVHRGEEHETVYEVQGAPADPHLTATDRMINPPRSVAALVPPGDIHHVENGGSALAVSLHVYGADIGKLGSSIRRRYDLEIRPA